MKKKNRSSALLGLDAVLDLGQDALDTVGSQPSEQTHQFGKPVSPAQEYDQ